MLQTWLKQRSTIGMQQIQVASSVLVRQQRRGGGAAQGGGEWETLHLHVRDD